MDSRHETTRARAAFLAAARHYGDGGTGELAFAAYMCESTPDTVLPMLSRFIMAGATEIGREFRDAALIAANLPCTTDELPFLALVPAPDADLSDGALAAIQLGSALANDDKDLAVDVLCARRTIGGLVGLVEVAVALVSLHRDVLDAAADMTA